MYNTYMYCETQIGREPIKIIKYTEEDNFDNMMEE